MDYDENGTDMAVMSEEESIFPEKLSLAMAYVPMQRFENIYDGDKALYAGTIFKALDLPFKGGRR